MAKKLKDYYDVDYCHFLGEKIKSVYPEFAIQHFVCLVENDLEHLEFNDRQVLLADALRECMPNDYKRSLAIFNNILGPELEGSLGMFSEGYWLWPVGKYVELFGYEYFEESTAFSKALTKRFTGEFCMRPILTHFPAGTMNLMLEWSTDENKRVRRLASECLRIRLPWAKRVYVALEYFDIYLKILSNLKNDKDKTIQKSVANNLNDLFKEDSEKFAYIINAWSKEALSKECAWIIKYGSRTKYKRDNASHNR